MNSRSVETMSQLMFIKLVGQPLNYFNPRYYINKWLSEGYRNADDTNSKLSTKDVAYILSCERYKITGAQSTKGLEF